MHQITDADEYDEFLDEVVENRNERDPSDEYHVAQNLIVDYRDIDGEITPTTVGTPYYDTTITPMSVINHASCDLHELLISGIREGAVKMLATDLKNHYHWEEHHDRERSRSDHSNYNLEGTRASTAYHLVDELDSFGDVEVSPDRNPNKPVAFCGYFAQWIPPQATKVMDYELDEYSHPNKTRYKEGYPPEGEERNRRVYVLNFAESPTERGQHAVDAHRVDKIAEALNVEPATLLAEIRLHPDPDPREERHEQTDAKKPPAIDLFDIKGHVGKIAIAPVRVDYLDELVDNPSDDYNED